MNQPRMSITDGVGFRFLVDVIAAVIPAIPAYNVPDERAVQLTNGLTNG